VQMLQTAHQAISTPSLWQRD